VDTALYFPHINPPWQPWFSQILLYWDQAAAIVPHQQRYDPDVIEPVTQDLVTHRLLTYPDLEESLWQRRDNFQVGFLDAVLPGLTIPPVGPRRATHKIYAGKMPYGMFQELGRRGLAAPARSPSDPEFWRVEATVANAYMAYLAAALSGASEGIVPVTDRQHAIATLAAPDSADQQRRDDDATQLAAAAELAADESSDERLNRLRYMLVRHALPAPSRPVPASELVKFKDAHADRLRRCRARLDAELVSLADVQDPVHRRAKAAELLLSIEDDVANLREQMQKRRWPKIVLVGVGGVVGVALGGAATVATGGAPLAIGLSVGGGVFSLGSAGFGLTELLSQPRYNQQAPFAYAALVGRL
jgi:hypothetical protein